MLTKKMVREVSWKSCGSYDVAVVGAGPGGIGAAIAAARRGHSVILVEKFGFPGGSGTTSCAPLYFGFGVDGQQTTAGLSEEFIRRMDEIGEASFCLNDQTYMPERLPIAGRPLTQKIVMRNDSMRMMHNRMLNEANVQCLFYSHMVDAVVEDGVIDSILVSCLEGPRLIKASIFIDATGDALLFHAAGAPVNKYDQDTCMHKSLFFYVGGVTGYDKQANNERYRKLYDENKTPFNVLEHMGVAHMLDFGVVQIGFGKASGDGVDSRDMTRMDGELREQVFQIVDFLRREMPGYRDCYLLETAIRVGVRAGQGIIGKAVMNEEIVNGPFPLEPIALTRRSYGHHSNQKKFETSFVHNQRGTSAVPLGAIQSPAIQNTLAAGRDISADPHIMGTFRMMNTCMTIGEAAGLAASVSLSDSVPANSVSYDHLRVLMDNAGFILPK